MSDGVPLDVLMRLPERDRARRLIGTTEDQWFGRKSARIAPKDLAEDLVGFANAEGGLIVVGLSKGVVERIDPNRENALRQAAIDFTRPTVRARVSRIPVLDSHNQPVHLLAIEIEPGDAVHETAGGDCYLRVGDETHRLGFAQRQELQFDRGSSQYEATPLTDVRIDELDPVALRAFAASIGTHPDDPAKALRARSLLTLRGDMTVAAYLLFAERPQDLLPQATVRVLRYRSSSPGTGRRQQLEAGADARFDGAIPHVIEAAAAHVSAWQPKRRALGDKGIFEDIPLIPADVWLEGLVNAVVHRSYSLSGDAVRVSIFPDSIEIESPGRFPGLADPRSPLTISRYARNPRIARVCSDLGITQELGEGIRRMFDDMRELGLSDPTYRQSSGSVTLTLSAQSRLDPALRSRLPMGADEALAALRTASRPLGTGELMDLLGRSRPWVTQVMGALRDEGQVIWNGKSTRDPRATWSIPVL